MEDIAALLDAGRDERRGRRCDPTPPCTFGDTGKELDDTRSPHGVRPRRRNAGDGEIRAHRCHPLLLPPTVVRGVSYSRACFLRR
nr:hypothetical protein Itr_chr12CG16820 [Ipomoea trifida]